MARKHVISVPVADLHREPKPLLQDYSHQDLRETQLLFGEKIEVLEQMGAWCKIAALEQLYFDMASGWQPYVGWVQACQIEAVDSFLEPSHVICDTQTFSYGTFVTEHTVRKLSTSPSRGLLVEDALLFIGAPYLWGGRSLHLGSPIASVDCSGLINLLYRGQGIIIPRNAHDQYLKAKPTPHLKPGDPLYLARAHRINHVILKLDDSTFIESPETGKNVRLLTWGCDIWEEKGRIHIFDRPHSYISYPTTFLSTDL